MNKKEREKETFTDKKYLHEKNFIKIISKYFDVFVAEKLHSLKYRSEAAVACLWFKYFPFTHTHMSTNIQPVATKNAHELNKTSRRLQTTRNIFMFVRTGSDANAK